MIIQLTFNSIISGLLLAVVAVGFNLIYNTTKVFHLAHGAIYVLGAYTFIYLHQTIGSANSIINLIISFILSLVIVILLSWIIELLIYQPLARKKSGQAITLISSMGIYIFIINSLALIFGNETKFLNNNLGGSFSILNIIIVPIQLIQFIISIILVGSSMFLSKCKIYLLIRSMISNETISSVIGVNSKAIRLFALALGSCFAAIASILRSYDTGIDPYSGMSITLSAAVAVIIGGNGSINGTVFASLLIAFLQTLTEWFLSAQWKEGITFVLLIIMVLWKTEGIISFKMRVEE
jgi:branched-chain amino acid transport system permease protein